MKKKYRDTIGLIEPDSYFHKYSDKLRDADITIVKILACSMYHPGWYFITFHFNDRPPIETMNWITKDNPATIVGRPHRVRVKA